MKPASSGRTRTSLNMLSEQHVYWGPRVLLPARLDSSHMSDFEPEPGVPLPPEQKAKADRILAERVTKNGAPTLEHYRRVYAACDLGWPGDEEIRRLYPVAETALSR